MDRPDNSASDLRGALRDIRWTNRWLGGRSGLLQAVRPFLLEVDRPLTVLDVGTGGADLPLALVRFARGLGRELTVVAVDIDPTTSAIAARETAGCSEVRVLCADARRLPFDGGCFDLVVASLFLHHFEDDEVTALLRAFSATARRAVVVNDLRRHLIPWAFIAAAARLTARHPMYVHDAPLSVLRGFTPDELRLAAQRAGAKRVRLERRWPYRLLMTLTHEAGA
jgi:SAM-dependent methyltransferase